MALPPFGLQFRAMGFHVLFKNARGIERGDERIGHAEAAKALGID
jgi:hypothetical protein